MRIGAVITIVGAHDARNAASRLTMPVPDGSRQAKSWPGGASETMNVSGWEAAGQSALLDVG